MGLRNEYFKLLVNDLEAKLWFQREEMHNYLADNKKMETMGNILKLSISRLRSFSKIYFNIT